MTKHCMTKYCLPTVTTITDWIYVSGPMTTSTLLWRHDGRDGVSNHQPHDCLLNRLVRRRSRKTSKLRVTGLCAGNSPLTGEFPTQRASKRKMFPFDDVIMICCTQTHNLTIVIYQGLLAVYPHWLPLGFLSSLRTCYHNRTDMHTNCLNWIYKRICTLSEMTK